MCGPFLPNSIAEWALCNGLRKCYWAHDAVRKQDEGEMRSYVVEEEVQWEAEVVL
jgi:hypothetical protein